MEPDFGPGEAGTGPGEVGILPGVGNGESANTFPAVAINNANNIERRATLMISSCYLYSVPNNTCAAKITALL